MNNIEGFEYTGRFWANDIYVIIYNWVNNKKVYELHNSSQFFAEVDESESIRAKGTLNHIKNWLKGTK